MSHHPVKLTKQELSFALKLLNSLEPETDSAYHRFAIINAVLLQIDLGLLALANHLVDEALAQSWLTGSTVQSLRPIAPPMSISISKALLAAESKSSSMHINDFNRLQQSPKSWLSGLLRTLSTVDKTKQEHNDTIAHYHAQTPSLIATTGEGRIEAHWTDLNADMLRHNIEQALVWIQDLESNEVEF
ncbi:MAG: hypothetical protein ACI93R_004176 [Flavobacteriales bacterium]|jgi:hypothetical protein